MKHYITTAIDYVNGSPHLGHALEKVQADVLARYHREKLGADNVYFLTGSDEHGTKLERAAKEAGKSPQGFADENVQRFIALKDALNLSWDQYIRTTDQEKHWPGVIALWKKLEEAGDLYKKKYGGYYCVGCEAFKTEREIADGHCVLHPTLKLEWVEEENWFFRLSKYQDQLLKHFEAHPNFVQPEHRRKEILNVIKDGLEDVSFSRPKTSLSWGIPVPGDDSQVMYVWCDALTNYISAIGYGRDEETFKEWWPADVHVIGKDILRFHAAIWPAMLLSAGLELPNQIFAHGFIHTAEGHLSKSAGNVVDPFELAEKYGTDALRYYLLYEIPSGGDGEFSIERFKSIYSADLSNGIGNTVQRVAVLLEKQSINPVQYTPQLWERWEKLMEERNFHECLLTLWESSVSSVSHVNVRIEQEKPWELIGREDEESKQRYSQTLTFCVLALLETAYYLRPFLPETSEKIEAIFTAEAIKAPLEPLFPRLDR